MANEKYLDLDGLRIYDNKIKNYMSGSISILSDEVAELSEHVSALNGAITYLGKIEKHTADVTQESLTDRVNELGYSSVKVGYTLVDLDANDWVVTDSGAESGGDPVWVNIGYYEVTQATNDKLGIVKGGEFISVNNNGEMYVNSLTATDVVTGNGLTLNDSLTVGEDGQFSVGYSGDVTAQSLAIKNTDYNDITISSGGISWLRGTLSNDPNNNYSYLYLGTGMIYGYGWSIGNGYATFGTGYITGEGWSITTGGNAYFQSQVSGSGWKISSDGNADFGAGTVSGSGWSISSGGNANFGLGVVSGGNWVIQGGGITVGNDVMGKCVISPTGEFRARVIRGCTDGIVADGGISATTLSIGTGGGHATISDNGDINTDSSISAITLNIGTGGGHATITSDGRITTDNSIVVGSAGGSFVTSGGGMMWSYGSLSNLSTNKYSYIDFGTGYITGSGWNISNGGNAYFVAVSGSGWGIQHGGTAHFGTGTVSGSSWIVSPTGLRIGTGDTYNSVVITTGGIKLNGQIVTTGSRLDALYLTGQFGSGVSFTGLSQQQINDLKTQLGL